MEEKKQFINELNSFIDSNQWLTTNGDWVVTTKWLRKFIEDHK